MFWENFYGLCHSKQMSPNGVAKEIGISSGAITAWKQGKVPHHDTLIKIANYFGVSVDYLLGNAEKEKPSEEGGGGEDVVVVNRSGKRFVHHLSPEQLDILSGMIEQMEKNNQ